MTTIPDRLVVVTTIPDRLGVVADDIRGGKSSSILFSLTDGGGATSSSGNSCSPLSPSPMRVDARMPSTSTNRSSKKVPSLLVKKRFLEVLLAGLYNRHAFASVE